MPLRQQEEGWRVQVQQELQRSDLVRVTLAHDAGVGVRAILARFVVESTPLYELHDHHKPCQDRADANARVVS
jgi:hypothetical protein